MNTDMELVGHSTTNKGKNHWPKGINIVAEFLCARSV